MVLYFSITITIIFIFFAFYFCHHSNNFFDQNFHFFYPQIFLTKKQTMPVEKLKFFDDFNFFIVYYMPIRIHILNVRKIHFTKNVNSTCIFTNMTIILKIIQILVFQKKNRKNCTNVSILIRSHLIC